MGTPRAANGDYRCLTPQNQGCLYAPSGQKSGQADACPLGARPTALSARKRTGSLGDLPRKFTGLVIQPCGGGNPR